VFYFSRVLQEDLQHELGEQQFSTATIMSSEINHEVVLRSSSLQKVAEQITPDIFNNTSKLQTLLEDRPILDILFNGGYFVAQTDGTIVADFPVSMSRIGINFSDRDWMIEALKGNATIGKPIVGKKMQVPVFTMASPIRDFEGKVIGVLAGITDLSKSNFLDRVVDNKYGKTGGFLLAAPQHNLFVTATDKKRIMQPMPAPGVNPLFDRYSRGFEGFGRAMNSLGVEELTASKIIPAAGWLLIVKTPITEAFAPFYDTQQHFIVATIIITLLVGCVIWWVLKRQLSPIFTTVDTLTRMSSGNQPADLLPVVRQDELGLLISGFNTLLKSKEKQEESLKLSEQGFRKAIEEAPYPIMIHAEDGEVLVLSRTWKELSGYTLADIPTIAVWTEKAYGIHKEPVIEEINTLYNLEHRKSEGEYTVNCHDGTKRNWDFSSVSISFLSDGRRTAMSMASDVTERKKSEKRIEEAAWRLELATASASLGVWDWNVKDNVMVWDDQMMALYGHTRQTFPGGIEAWQNGLHHDDREATWEACQSALRGDSEWNHEFRIMRPDGAVRCIKANGEVLWGQDGSPVRMLGINRDITERKENEILIKEKELLFRESQQAAMVGSYKCDFIAGKWESTEVLDTIFGIDADYVRSIQGWLNIVHPDDRDMMDRYLMEEVISNRKTFSKEYRIIRQNDGEIRWVDGRGKAEFDNAGNILSLIGTIQEISERKKAENEKAKLESQLHQAQKMESIGSLAGGVAHDFNNKLSVILGYAQLAQMVAGPESEVYSHLQEVCKAAESSADLTRQLLAFARQQTIVPKMLDLNETITGMFKMLNRLIGENIHLDWQTKSDLWPINFDPSQIDQILANLCVNARDSVSENGKITIETENCTINESYVTRHPYVVEGDYVKIAVSDNGCGMNKETIDRIFEPFFTTKEEGKGTGLGLATVFGIVKQNNGFINVYSEPGIGTTFTLYIPRYLGKTKQIGPEGPTIPTPRGLETILLVEDELGLLNMAAMILTRQGYTVLSANSAKEALRLAQENAGRIDLLITDVIMPEMNGKELTHALQSRNPQLKSIFMSGYTADVISQHGVLEEGVNFIQKPFALPDLAHKVRDVLDSK
jgi:PAS domain S-box-containing protein